MNDLIAYLAARDHTAEIAQEARPDSPIRPDRPRRALRFRVSMALRRLADRLAPSHPPTELNPSMPTGADCR